MRWQTTNAVKFLHIKKIFLMEVSIISFYCSSAHSEIRVYLIEPFFIIFR